jgi:hypothetical protein
MAGITTPALAALSAYSAIKRTGGVVDDILGGGKRTRALRRAEAVLDQRQASQRVELEARQDDAAAVAARQREEATTRLSIEADLANRRRTRALRRAVGRLRAQLGAQGISTADGSGEAILLGQIRETEEEAEAARQLDRLRLRTLEAEAEEMNRSNLLERARLLERQRLERIGLGG